MKIVKNLINRVLEKTVSVAELAVLGIVVIATISYALAWNPPSGNPPANNVDAPLNVGAAGQSKSGGLLLNTGGAPTGLIVQNGNVGIGTTNATSALTFGGLKDATISTDTSDGSDNKSLNLDGGGGGGYSRGSQIGLYGNEYDVANMKGMVIIRPGNVYTGGESGSFQVRTAGDNIRMIVNYDGNVGIGTASPQWKLDVVGGSMRADGYVSGGQLCIGGDCRSSWGTPIYQCPVFNDGCPGTCGNNLSLSPTCTRGSSSEAFCRAWGGATESCTLVGRLVAP